ncbi:MAG: c-type cytochrome [Acidobacteriota bacterium]
MITLNRSKFIFLIALIVAGLLAGYWFLVRSGPVSPERLLPVQMTNEKLTPGLVATYSDSKHSIRLTSPSPGFYLAPSESVHPSLSAAFTAEWEGLISILEAGSYVIRSGGAAVYLHGQEIATEPVQLSVGRYPIRIEYRRRQGPAQLQLEWSTEHFPPEPIPSSAFSHPASQSVDESDALVERGRYLVQEYGCVNCHQAGSASLKGFKGPDLSDVGSRTSQSWIYNWLENPKEFRSGAVMPAMLDEGERGDVSAYLASLKSDAGRGPLTDPRGSDGGRGYSKPNRARQGAATADLAQGKQLYGSIGCAACHEQEGLSLKGMGSKMQVPPLAQYLKDPGRIDPGGRMPSMMLSDEEAVSLATFLVDSRNPAFEDAPGGGDPHRGRELIQSQGCLSCHDIQGAGSLSNQLRALRLEELSLSAGCLSEAHIEGLPRYALKGEEIQAIEAFLTNYRRSPDISGAPVYEFYQQVEQLRCTACHQLEYLGPAGQLPETAPMLTGAGRKLRTSWIQQVLTNRRRVRPWLEIRMPHYGSDRAAGLAEGFAKAGGLEPGAGKAEPEIAMKRQVRGISLLGNSARKGGLACIRCHDWGEYRAQGELGPQLLSTTDRLRYDWFYRFMLNPARILSGTSMPDYFSPEDTEEADEAIPSLWAALSMGPDMPLPDGLASTEELLAASRPIPEGKPLVLRVYMPEATPASIAVGAPGGISYCFDAGECRLSYAWQGGFIDMAELLQAKVAPDKSSPEAKLVGEIFYRSESFPLRVGSTAKMAEVNFRGYRIVNDYPEFHYEVDGIQVRELILPIEQNIGIRRRFTIERVDRPLWLSHSQEEGASVSATLGPFEDGRIRIPEGEQVQFELTIRSRGSF